MTANSMSRSPMSPPISWIGGKRSILAEILLRFPPEYERYIEVFGGSGVVVFGKEPAPFEVWNDYNGDLYNFYYCVKYKHISLMKELGFLPLNSRADFFLMKSFLEGKGIPQEDIKNEQSLAKEHFTGQEAKELNAIIKERCSLGDISRAAAFFKLNRLSYGSGMTSYSSQPCDLRRFYGQISAAHDRLCGIILENKDFEALITQYDRPGSFFYLDPPYYMAEDLYAVQFTGEDHYRLFKALQSIQGRFLLSYNDEPFIRELYRDYPQYRFTRLSNLVQRYEGGAEYGEILIANYDMDEQKNTQTQLSLFNLN